MIELGTHIHTFGTNKVTSYVLVGVAVVCSLFAAFALWLAISQYNAPPGVLDEMGFGESSRKDGLLTGSVIAALNLLVAIGCVAASRYQNSVRAELYEEGLVSYRGKRIQTAKWTDIERVVEHRFESITHASRNRRRSVRYYVKVHTFDQQVILLRGIENVRRAGELIAQQCDLELQQVRD